MPRGGFGGGRGFGGGGGFGMRRGGYPLMMGGMGMGGMGMGSPLLTGLMAGGLGYMLGSNSNQNTAQQPAPAPAAQLPYPPQYYPAPPAPQADGDGGTLAQLKLLGQLHESGTLTDEEFASEKQKLLTHA